MTSNIVCDCAEIIMKSENGVGKIRSKILLVKSNQVFAVCKGCGSEIEVPLTKAVTTPISSGPPLFLLNK